MGQVSVAVNGRNYNVACDDGEEEHLQSLAAFVDKQVVELASQIGQVGDTRLLLMSNLLISDKLGEALGRAEQDDTGAKSEDRPPSNAFAEMDAL
ncbi:MAG: cell division protein ZapA, partial [Amylibacter sp.]